MLRPRQLHRVLDAVAVLDELREAPRANVELLAGQLVVGVERVEDREPDLHSRVVVAGGHAVPCRPLGLRT